MSNPLFFLFFLKKYLTNKPDSVILQSERGKENPTKTRKEEKK